MPSQRPYKIPVATLLIALAILVTATIVVIMMLGKRMKSSWPW